MTTVQNCQELFVRDTLRRFGITKRYIGYSHLGYCLQLVIADDNRLVAVTKEVYMQKAAYFECRWSNVERNIRTLAARAWDLNSTLLTEMAGYPLNRAPAAAEFLEILATYFLRNQSNASDV